MKLYNIIVLLLLVSLEQLTAVRIDRDQLDELKVELKDALEEINEEAHDTEFIVEIDANDLLRLEHLGESWKFPACSCKEIAERQSNWTSGYYWVRPMEGDRPRLIYCELERKFEGSVGWTRVAHLDMTTQTQCPRNLKLLTPGSVRLCGKSRDGYGCDSVNYETFGITYQQVCGRAVGFHGHTADGFIQHECSSPCTIDDPYVDGLSITHGSYPRKHIWTYSQAKRNEPPAYIGDNYYCENGYNSGQRYDDVFLGDILWDGQQCHGEPSRCCGIPGMPWFCTTLPEPTRDRIEVRWCTDENLQNEDVPIQLVELFIR